MPEKLRLKLDFQVAVDMALQNLDVPGMVPLLRHRTLDNRYGGVSSGKSEKVKVLQVRSDVHCQWCLDSGDAPTGRAESHQFARFARRTSTPPPGRIPTEISLPAAS